MRTLSVLLLLAPAAAAAPPPHCTLPGRAPPACTLPPRADPDPSAGTCLCFRAGDCGDRAACGWKGQRCRCQGPPPPPPAVTGWRLPQPGEVPTHLLTPDGRVVPLAAPPAPAAVLPAYGPPMTMPVPLRGGAAFRGAARGGC